MNEVELWQQLGKVLPPRVHAQIHWVHERIYWSDFEISFRTHQGYKIVRIPKGHWLNDAAIARLCLEAP